MRKSILLLPQLFFIVVSCFSQNPTKLLGTVEIDKVSSIDQTEVTIQEYVYFIINNNFDLDLFPNPQSISPSTKVFFADLRKQNDLVFIELEKNHPVMQVNYGNLGFKLTKEYEAFVATDTSNFSIWLPMVGISYGQAKSFCEWREGVVNSRKAVQVKITLPPMEVYKKLNDNVDSISTKLKRDSCLRYQFNYHHEGCIPSKKYADLKSQGKGLVNAGQYSPTKLNLYCIQGNAAEMTSTEGVAVGGSFQHAAKDSFSNQVQLYKKEENWLGFRCLITLK